MVADPNLRRETPLLGKLRDRIEKHGPLSIERFMRACLFDVDYGYYKTANVLGRAGDFITAPEISQTFGELIGLWCVAVWQQMGAPAQMQVVEFGAGRGTLLSDALRASQRVPAFYDALSVSIIDTHPGLRQHQADTLKPYAQRISWPEELFELQAAPTILIANEFLDCLPIDQFVATPETHPGWQRRRVGLDDQNQLQFMLGRFEPPPHAKLPHELDGLANALNNNAAEGDIIETRALVGSELSNLKDFVFCDPANPLPFAGLFIDYGHTRSALGDTLQAVRNHAFEHPLTSPGEADLTAHVDFEHFAGTMRDQGFAIDGPVGQGDFLGRLGIVERASQLMSHNPTHASDIEMAVARLISPTGMGGRFHALGLRTPDVAPLPGLAP